MAFSKVVVGQSIRCSVIFRDWNGSPVDVDDGYLDATVYDPNEDIILIINPAAIIKQEIGFYYYDYQTSGSDTLGVYRILWATVISGVPVVYNDYFQTIGYPTATSDTLIGRIKQELRGLAEELTDAEYERIQIDAEADVMDVSIMGLAWHNKWEILWLTKRGVRHSLQRILNDHLDSFAIAKSGKSLALDQPARAIMQRITQIDTEFEKARAIRFWDGVHWVYRPTESATTSATQTMAYDVDPYTGLDRTPYYDSQGILRRSADDEDLEYYRDY